ncbi:phosphatase 2C-like domain-containing protein [Syncephalis pseudoplumigaleata]|uniref:Protein phosphatase n=1 Tax=Syncephalis pseudoplumigaleata TaxID=1712513 RepID=A0A4P9YSR9_9FUNG|nr:phosphatase 2C-like domain-containing protein [Syncephalis pseudoplumigaleata]|eukprot:RKP22795.1 phosphatase 2C-like domain-containing protein [Syncephalis pseudoplumigaleata]
MSLGAASPLASDVQVGRPVGRGIFDFFKEADFTRTRASFRFDHAVAGFAKHPNRPVAPDTEIFLSERYGEDACFRRHDSLGVADGVGGITQLQGGDSSMISRKIMHYACMELERYDNIEDEAFGAYYMVDPVSILTRGYDRAAHDMKQQGIEGATTACLAVLRDDELRIANLGDSGVLVLRRGDFVFRTEAQQRSFNVPYQLGYPTRDQPTDAQHFTVKLERGDIVILATDGMFDNLFDEDIIDEVTKCIRANTRGAANPVDISHALACRARDVSEDSRYATSPFQSRAVAEGFYYQGGGKLDDITVIVAVVSDLEDTPDRR